MPCSLHSRCHCAYYSSSSEQVRNVAFLWFFFCVLRWNLLFCVNKQWLSRLVYVFVHVRMQRVFFRPFGCIAGRSRVHDLLLPLHTQFIATVFLLLSAHLLLSAGAFRMNFIANECVLFCIFCCFLMPMRSRQAKKNAQRRIIHIN